MKRRLTRIGVLCLALTLCLATMAVGYGHWSRTLVIDGTVTTGSIEVVFTEPAYSSPAITGWTDDPPAPPESLDPSSDWELVEVSPGVWEWIMVSGSWHRIFADIAFTDVLLEPDERTLTVTLSDAWACYNPTVYYDMTNNGTVPVAISSIVVTVPDKVPFDCNGDGTIDPGEEARPVTAELSGVAVGSVIDGGSSLPGELLIHVTDAAAFEATYVITVTFEVVNWNEVGP